MPVLKVLLSLCLGVFVLLFSGIFINAHAAEAFGSIQGAMIDKKTKKPPETTILVKENKLPAGPVAQRSRDFMQTQIADAKSWQSIAATVPGVVLNPFGQMHVRGDHNLVTFSLDGALLPVVPEGEIGALIDPRFLSGMEVQTGSFDPSASGQLGTVVTMTPFQSGLPSHFEIEPSVGDHQQRGFLGSWDGGSPDGTWRYFIGGQTQHTDLFLSAPQPAQQTLNNTGDDSSGFLRISRVSGEDTYHLALGRQVDDFQIPNTPGSQAAGVNQHERNSNDFGVFTWQRPWSSRIESQFAFAWLSSAQAVTNNGVFTPFVAANPATMPNAFAGGFPANPVDYGSPYLPVINRGDAQYLFSFTIAQGLTPTNHLEYGGRADIIRYQDFYNILDAGGSGLLPSPQILLSLNRTGFNGAVFLSDHFTFSDRLHADMGLNAGRFSDGFQITASQLNPLVNLAYSLSRTQTLRFSFDHVFNAPPLEPDLTGAVVQPENANEFELSYEQQLAKELKFHIGGYVKNFHNQIDGALLLPLSNIPIFNPASFDKSIDDGVEVSLTSSNQTGLNGFLNYAYAIAKSAAVPGNPSVFLDHDQRHTLTFGTSYRWNNGVYAGLDNRYGSGFPQATAQIYNRDGIFPYGINGRVSNFISNLSIGYKPFLDRRAGSSAVGASLDILNLFNSTRNINFISDFTGTRFVKERQISFNVFANF